MQKTALEAAENNMLRKRFGLLSILHKNQKCGNDAGGGFENCARGRAVRGKALIKPSPPVTYGLSMHMQIVLDVSLTYST